jgi:hypothetical protein
MKLIYYTLITVCFSFKSFGYSSIPELNSNLSPVNSEVTNSENNSINIISIEDKKKDDVYVEKLAADSRLKIRLGFYATSNFKRQILFTFDQRASDGIDYGFDALLKDVFPNDLYWVLNNNKYNIQATKEWSNKCVIPIGIKSKGDGPVKIKIDAIENPTPNMEVYIRDNATMETYDIVNGKFEINLEEGEFNDKYAIVFEPKAEITEEEDLPEEELIVVDNPIEFMEVYVGGMNQDHLKIKKPDEMELTHISIFNVLGQQIKVWNSNLNQREMELFFPSNKGVHLVVMSTNKGRISKKLIVN